MLKSNAMRLQRAVSKQYNLVYPTPRTCRQTSIPAPDDNASDIQRLCHLTDAYNVLVVSVGARYRFPLVVLHSHLFTEKMHPVKRGVLCRKEVAPAYTI